MSSATEYPLCWPDMMPRQRVREKGQFRTTLNGALENVRGSLRRFAADSGKTVSNVVISSNVTLGNARPADPGVAIWFVWDGLSVCIPVDRYSTVEGNLQAIHHVLEARRTELRHGTLALVRATMTGFAALPAPASKKSWRQVLLMKDFDAGMTTADMIEQRYRALAKKAHPDAGGSTEAMAELNAARAEALREIGGGA